MPEHKGYDAVAEWWRTLDGPAYRWLSGEEVAGAILASPWLADRDRAAEQHGAERVLEDLRELADYLDVEWRSSTNAAPEDWYLHGQADAYDVAESRLRELIARHEGGAT